MKVATVTQMSCPPVFGKPSRETCREGFMNKREVNLSYMIVTQRTDSAKIILEQGLMVSQNKVPPRRLREAIKTGVGGTVCYIIQERRDAAIN